MKLFFQFFLQTVKKNKLLYFLIYFFSLVIIGIKITLPLFYKVIVDRVSADDGVKNFFPLILWYVLFLFVSNIINVLWYETMNIAGVIFLRQMRNRLFEKIIHVPFEKTVELGRERIKNILFSDVMQMFSSLTVFSVQFIANVFVLLIGIIIAFVVNIGLGFAFSAFAVIGFMLSFFSRKIIKRQSKKVNTELKAQNAVTNSFVDSLELFKTHDLDSYITEKHSFLMERFLKTILKADGIQVFFKNLTANINSLFTLLSICILLIFKRNSSVGDVLFLSFIAQFLISVSAETEAYISQIYAMLPAFENVNEILELPEVICGNKKWNGLKSISFESVSFAYESADAENDKLLQDLNFQFCAGDRIKVVGENGSGKTTFIKMLSGLLQPSQGKIKINGEDFCNFDRGFLKQKILYVSQDETILNETILDYFKAMGIHFSKEELAEKLALWNFKMQNAANIDDMHFTDNAKNLSGGMRKKILAIKLFEKIKEADIIIVDEICAGLDAGSEKQFYRFREKYFSGKSDKIYFEISNNAADNKFFTRKIEFTEIDITRGCSLPMR